MRFLWVGMRLVGFVVFTVALHCLSLLAQNPVSSSATAEKLGSVSFPISCSSAVRPEFDRAVALLHSFQYALAESSFGRVAEQEPQCAMAYWGEAMGLYHPLFDWPDNETLKKGNEYIEQGMKTGVKTERERDYIRAAAAFYQDTPKLNRNARLSAYSKAMAEVYQRYPQDGEAAAFYALSLLPSYRDDQPQAQPVATPPLGGVQAIPAGRHAHVLGLGPVGDARQLLGSNVGGGQRGQGRRPRHLEGGARGQPGTDRQVGVDEQVGSRHGNADLRQRPCHAGQVVGPTRVLLAVPGPAAGLVLQRAAAQHPIVSCRGSDTSDAVDRQRKDEAAVVVGVLAYQIDATRRRPDPCGRAPRPLGERFQRGESQWWTWSIGPDTA